MACGAAPVQPRQPQESCQDLMFRLYHAEANGGNRKPNSNRYTSLLSHIEEYRRTRSPLPWVNQALMGAVGSHEANALRWLLGSSPCRLEPMAIPPCAHSGMTFFAVVEPEDREERFQKLHQAYGSDFAFHGSSITNFASILRLGLRSLSSTNHQANGSIHGEGIYLSSSPAMCALYSGFDGKNEQNAPASTRTLKVMAFCEVANIPAPGLDKIHNGAIYLVKNSDAVKVRVLIVTEEGAPSSWPAVDVFAHHLKVVRGSSLLPPPLPAAPQAPCAAQVCISSWEHYVSQDGSRRYVRYSVHGLDSASRSLNESSDASKATKTKTMSGTGTGAGKGDEQKKTISKEEVAMVMARTGDSLAPGEKADHAWRRFSDFEELHRLVRPYYHAERPFPPRRLWERTCCGLSRRRLDERKELLEAWLQEVLDHTRDGVLPEEFKPVLCAFLAAWGPYTGASAPYPL